MASTVSVHDGSSLFYADILLYLLSTYASSVLSPRPRCLLRTESYVASHNQCVMWLHNDLESCQGLYSYTRFAS